MKLKKEEEEIQTNKKYCFNKHYFVKWRTMIFPL
jgi:hypothetical protein